MYKSSKKNCLHNFRSDLALVLWILWHRLIGGEGIGYFIFLSPAPELNVSSVTCPLPSGLHIILMPIKDITNEEKSNLYMVGKKPKEVQRISESERGNRSLGLKRLMMIYYSNLQHCAAALLLQSGG